MTFTSSQAHLLIGSLAQWLTGWVLVHKPVASLPDPAVENIWVYEDRRTKFGSLVAIDTDDTACCVVVNVDEKFWSCAKLNVERDNLNVSGSKACIDTYTHVMFVDPS